MAIAVPAVILSAITGYYYVKFSKMIDARLHGEMQRADPRVFARPFELRRGQSFTPTQLVDRLNDLGYSHRAKTEQPGEFTIGRDAILVIPRDGDHRGRPVRIVFGARGTKAAEPGAIANIEVVGSRESPDTITLDPPLITALVSAGREKRRDVPLASIPPRMVQAVLAIEDRRFYEHPGIDPIGIASAVFGYAFSNKSMRGGSTITQQLVKNTFLTQERTLKRKFSEWIMSIALERRLSKDQVLELYLNDVWLGQRGSFAIHGVPEASRLFFAKDVSNVSLSEAATIAGMIQSPPRTSPFTYPDKAKERRNVVLRAMADSGYITTEAAERASKEPLQIVARALDAEAPYFVDFIGQELADKYKSATGAVDVYTTLDLHMQRIAQDALRSGLARV
ncbi:MAG TPA: transglycosylase domain-containing protein, partial [Vicinamibacterales bacterium]